MRGIVKSVNATSISIETDNGAGNVTKSIRAGATVTKAGATIQISDVKVGDTVVLSGDPVTSIVVS